MSYNKVSFFDAINANKRNSILLLLAFSLFFMLIVALFSYMFDLGAFGIFIGMVVLAIYAAISFFAGDKAILSMSGARELKQADQPFVYLTVEGLSAASAIPMPKLYIIEDDAPNAFAVGRDPKHASIAVTRGLLNTLNREELEGVLAHEVSHIANFDVRFALIAIVFVGAIGLISGIVWRSFFYSRNNSRRGGGNAAIMIIGLILMILAPVFATLIRLAISRQREYLADANAVKLIRYNGGLASALDKISRYGKPVQAATDATAPMYFSNPLPKVASLFSTHPSAEDRIARLRHM